MFHVKHVIEYVKAALLILLGILAAMTIIWAGLGEFHEVYLPDVKPPHMGHVGVWVAALLAVTVFVRLAWNFGDKD